MSDKRDFRMQVPPHRRLSWDLTTFNRAVPLCPHDRRMKLSEVNALRQAASERVGWPALFIHAFAHVAADIPELRQSWRRFPLPHLFQHADSSAVITVSRRYQDADWLFWGRIASPTSLTPLQIQQQINHYRDQPVKKTFSSQLQLASCPLPLRRLIWWWNMNVAGSKRAKRLGTFFLSTLAARGVEILSPPSIQTSCLSYGPLDKDGVCRVTLAYDHRILDGALAATALEQLEQQLPVSASMLDTKFSA